MQSDQARPYLREIRVLNETTREYLRYKYESERRRVKTTNGRILIIPFTEAELENLRLRYNQEIQALRQERRRMVQKQYYENKKKQEQEEKLREILAANLKALEKREEAIKNRKLKIIEKLVARKRFHLKPKVSTYKSYRYYQIPASLSRPFIQMGKSNYLPMTETKLDIWRQYIMNYMSRTIYSNMKEFNFVRLFITVQFLLVDTKTGETYPQMINFGRTDTNNVFEVYEYFSSNLEEQFAKLNERDYAFVYGIGDVSIHIGELKLTKGASYSELPKIIKDKKAIINIKNNDQKCFLWCVIAHSHKSDHHPERVAQYEKYTKEFIYQETDFPMGIQNISKFEKANNLRVNVFYLEKKYIAPMYISKQSNHDVINLFFHDNHYSLIKDFSRLMGKRQFVCFRCLKSYAKKECLDRHSEICMELNENGSLVKTCDPNTVTKYNNYKAQKKTPVAIYADFESSLNNTNSYIKNGIAVEKNYVSAVHQSNSYRIRIESIIDLQIPIDYEYIGSDSGVHFIRQIVDLDQKITKRLQDLSKMYEKCPQLTPEETKQYYSQKCCKFCTKPFDRSDKENFRVRDHCHFTGKFEGAAHKNCNIKAHQMFKGKLEIPLFFHNANYDIRQFINSFRELEGNENIRKIDGVPCNMEFFKCLRLNNIVIKDSYAHMSSSLDKLIKLLPEDKKTRLRSIVGEDDEKFKLVCKKGYYPYEFVDSIDKLDTPLSELKPHHFNSRLTLFKLSPEENDTEEERNEKAKIWNHIQKVIETFEMKTLRDYHKLYLKIDVLGLADVFEYYRKTAFKNYVLDPAHYIGLPAFTWDAGLKYTGVELENISDIDMFMFFEKAKRGGISVISTKYCKANNKYLPDYDSSKPASYIMQYDRNNLYGWAMKQKLPIRNFRWVENFDIASYSPTGDMGYMLEVDLEYPEHLHDEHNDYPLAPEHMMMGKNKKLTPNLNDKEKYIVYIDNLLYYLEKGLVLKKIHRVLGFERSNWLEKYIDFNSKKRQEATNDFEKDLYKLMNNAFYGKTMENERDRVNIQFCLNKESFQKHFSSPLFANQLLVVKEDGLALVKTHKKVVVLRKPIYTGAVVLELSKLTMFQFHYDTMKVEYPNCKMMKTDTDSLMYYIECDDIYEDMNKPKLQSKIEFSNYPKHNGLYSSNNKKDVNYYQDEVADDPDCLKVISEYVGLRAKCYSNKIWCLEKGEYLSKKKSKGVSGIHVKKRLTHEDYKNCYENKVKIVLGDLESSNEKHRDTITAFRSIGLRTYTTEIKKIALSYQDDKRVLCENEIDTYAIGHWRTKI